MHAFLRKQRLRAAIVKVNQITPNNHPRQKKRNRNVINPLPYDFLFNFKEQALLVETKINSG